MKPTHKILSLLITLCLVLSCSSRGEDQPSATGEASIRFCVTNYEQLSLDASRAAAIDSIEHLAFVLYGEDGCIVQQQTQQKTKQGYETFQTTLPYGNYQLVVLGYDGSRQPDLTNPHAIHFQDGWVPNCFLHYRRLVIDAGTETTQSVSLQRCVGAFNLVCTDNWPHEAAMVDMQTQGGATLDATIGLAADQQTRTYRITMPSQYQNPVRLTYYAFLPAASCTMDITLTTRRADGTQHHQRTFSQVPMKLNQLTRYTGQFFTPDEQDAAFRMDIQGTYAWNNILEQTF